MVLAGLAEIPEERQDRAKRQGYQADDIGREKIEHMHERAEIEHGRPPARHLKALGSPSRSRRRPHLRPRRSTGRRVRIDWDAAAWKSTLPASRPQGRIRRWFETFETTACAAALHCLSYPTTQRAPS